MFASVATGVSVDDINVPSKAIRNMNRDGGVETVPSDADFDTTYARLLAAIEASAANVEFVVDHATNSGGVLQPTRLIVFGNPQLGTPVMQASATAGVDLPLKILVWEDDTGTTQVTTNSVDYRRKRHRIGRNEASESLTRITGAIGNFVKAATESA
jgi:uncharacterized protein (DUF302 family)